jgi:16S rRNA (guanine(966)-N(2))-methyltransferase RsmD
MVPGESTRPIGDRVKESLFNIIGPEIEGAVFLDLFAGTGSVGTEALSRGAFAATFVEKNPAALKTIEMNLDHTELLERASVTRMDVFRFLEGAVVKTFDYIYVAPPQYRELWAKALKLLDQRIEWMNPDAWVIIQIDPIEITTLNLNNLVHFDQRRYGGTQLDFYELPGE